MQIAAEARQHASRCPDCGEPSHAVHSRAVRRPADLPCLGREVRLELAVRRLYCRNPACSRLQQDGTAVKAALTTTWSNGRTEGQVGKLKMLKRQTFGRSSFDLLRRRVLLAA
jgi:transposase